MVLVLLVVIVVVLAVPPLPGRKEQAKVLPGEYDEWKRENYMSERRVKEGGGGKKGGGVDSS